MLWQNKMPVTESLECHACRIMQRLHNLDRELVTSNTHSSSTPNTDYLSKGFPHEQISHFRTDSGP